MRSQSVRFKALEELRTLRAEFNVRARLNEQRRRALDRAQEIAQREELRYWTNHFSRSQR